MNNSISIDDLISFHILENEEGRITLTLNAEEDFIYIDCGIPANLIIGLNSERTESMLVSNLNKAVNQQVSFWANTKRRK
jgi:hypothetical protein